MNENQRLRRCFIIGPMKNMDRLYLLRDAIVRPLLEPYGFTVKTPDEGDIGSIMRQVLLDLEQADLLVADLTGNNPNVMYELGIYHAFGKPYIALKDTSFAVELDQTPFDIADYRFLTIDLRQPETARQRMNEWVQRVIPQLDERDWFGNPVTDFYRSPIAEIPTAVGLFKNYRRNFLSQFLPDVFFRNESNDDFRLKVLVEDQTNHKTGQQEFRSLTPDEMVALTVEILIPQRMKWAEHDFITSLKQRPGQFPYQNAKVVKRTREFTLHVRQAADGHYVLADIPTVLSTLNDSIRNRRALHEDMIESEEWGILETQELERFASRCVLFYRNIESSYPSLTGKIRVDWRWNPTDTLL